MLKYYIVKNKFNRIFKVLECVMLDSKVPIGIRKKAIYCYEFLTKYYKNYCIMLLKKVNE